MMPALRRSMLWPLRGLGLSATYAPPDWFGASKIDGGDRRQRQELETGLDKSKVSGFNHIAIDRGLATNNNARRGNA
jgi:hypothetical protein